MGLITPLDRYCDNCGSESEHWIITKNALRMCLTCASIVLHMSDEEIAAILDQREMAANLRALADMIEIAGMPQAHYARPRIDIYTEDISDARQAMALSPGGWEKINSEDSYYVTYRKTFGTGAYKRNATSYEVFVSKEATCKRIQTGTRHVPASEAHDEPTYGWDCSGMPDTQ